MGTENLDSIFKPNRIAVIGASDREVAVGSRLLRNLIGVGYKGVVYPVNPFRSTVQGITAYPSLLKIPWTVDLAVIVTPAHTVPQIVEECGNAGVAGIIIVSAGFKEAGEEGAALERKIEELRKKFKMRIIGPNSLGVMRPKINLNATFANRSALPGKIAFISQSAALCASVLDWASEAHVGFSTVVSTGSMLDVDLGDLIDYFGADGQTRSIVVFLESISNARKFMSAARGIARVKPIVVVKAGRFPESLEATISHTGALCGEDAVNDAAFSRVGVVRVEAIGDLFNCASALAMQPNPLGPNLTIITNAGGPGILATDCLVSKGGRLSSLSKETVQALKNALPPYCCTANPVDIFEEADPNRLRKVIEICFNDPNSDGFLFIYTPIGATDPVSFAKTLLEFSGKTAKPVLASLIGEGDCWKARQILQKNGIPSFTMPEQAVMTFMYMYSYTQNLELLHQTPEELPVEFSIPKFLKQVLRRAHSHGQTILNLHESLQFLFAYGIPTVNTLVVRTSKEAEAVASELCCPIVMKALSPQMTHKSKAGGVILNVWSPPEARIFFDELAAKIRKFDPQVEFPSVAIQPMIRKRGYELLIGSKKDPQFGSVIVFGAGGTATEICKDISVGFPPLNRVLARRLIEKTAIYKQTIASEGSLNLKVLEETLVKFSQIVIDFPEIKEIEINPLIVDENEALAVDARIVIDPERILKEVHPYEHLAIAPYPAKYVGQWQLKDGTPVTLRPIKPEDETLFQELFKSFSEETMRFRFFQIIKDVTHETLTRYCNIDYDREMAIVAETQQDKRRIIGAVRLITEPGRNCGEFAVVVGDRWQGHGLGSKLLDYIIEIGREAKLDEIYGFVISENVKMMNTCAKKGFVAEPAEEGISKIVLKLS